MRYTDQAASIAHLQPGQRVFVPGSSGAPTAWMEALLADPNANRGLAITTTSIPGINRLNLDRLHHSARIDGLFAFPTPAAPPGAGGFRHLPVSYSGFLRQLADQPPFDVVVVQVCPPDAHGMCSLGPLVEFSQLALARAVRRVAVVNETAPAMQDSCAVPVDLFDEWVEGSASLPEYATGAIDGVAAAVAGHVAGFVEDGVTLQIGLGKIPAAVMAELGGRRNLRFHSGMLSDGLMALDQQGALAADHAHIACALVGSRSFYEWAPKQAWLRLRGCEVTHGPGRLAALERFVAINSALQVDLFGQCNAEFVTGQAVSGPGGAPDFAAAARRCAGGLSIVAMPASSHGASRIQAQLTSPATLARSDVDVVVTEYGAADLRGLSVQERAERLINIAMPAARSALATGWSEIIRASCNGRRH